MLSASTGGTAIIEDPTYNPAARPTTQTQPIVTESSPEDENFIMALDEQTKKSLIGILVVLVLIVGCCFGCGTLTICFYKVTKAN